MKALKFEEGVDVWKPPRGLKKLGWGKIFLRFFVVLCISVGLCSLGEKFGMTRTNSGELFYSFGLLGILISFAILSADVQQKRAKPAEPRTTRILKLNVRVKRIATTWGSEDLGPYWVLEMNDGTRLALAGQALMDIKGRVSVRPRFDKERDLICKEYLELWFDRNGHSIFGGKTWGEPVKAVEQHKNYKDAVAFEKRYFSGNEHRQELLSWSKPKKPMLLFDELLEPKNLSAKALFPSHP